jgi:peptidoglycan/xylan/chitin deacetylase (PgdA/CDA1 family)
VALTFDGGAGNQGLARILDTLRVERVHATFFVTGAFAANNPELVAAIVAGGHRIGNHTRSHPHSRALSSAELRLEVTEAEATITRTAGANPRPWFRFPYGEYDARTLKAVNALGYAAVGWTVDSKGWLGQEAGTAADVAARVLAARSPGAIVIMHVGANPEDHTTYDADALPTVIHGLRAAGYGFVTLDSALG